MCSSEKRRNFQWARDSPCACGYTPLPIRTRYERPLLLYRLLFFLLYLRNLDIKYTKIATFFILVFYSSYSFILLFKFHDMVSIRNLHWRYLLMNGAYRWRQECGHVTFPETYDMCNFLLEMSTSTQAINLTFARKKTVMIKGPCKICRTEYIIRKSHVIKLIKSLTNFIYQNVSPM